jgi:hypothetical protein
MKIRPTILELKHADMAIRSALYAVISCSLYKKCTVATVETINSQIHTHLGKSGFLSLQSVALSL